MKTFRIIAPILGLALATLPAFAADLNVTGNLTVTGTVDSDGSLVTFGTQAGSYGAGQQYTDSSTDTLKFLINRNPASWLWVHNTNIPAMRLDSAHQLILYNAAGTTAGVTLTPVSNQISLGTATLTGSGTMLTAGGALTVTNGITNTSGTLTGGATGLTLNAGGTNQNILLLPSGTGKVGVGTTGPAYKLDVRTPGSTSSQLHIASTDTDAGGYLTSTSDQNSYLSAGAAYNGTSWIAKGTSYGIVGSHNGVINFLNGTGTTAGSTLTTNERMRIDPNGNVGIGTTAPATKLDVQGDGSDSQDTFRVTRGAGNAARLQFGHNYIQRVNGDGTYGSILMNVNGGNVGIGTPSPTLPFEVWGTGTAGTVAIYNTSASSNNTSAGLALYNNDGAALAAGDRFLAIVGGGNTGAGLANAVAILGYADTSWTSGSNYGTNLVIQTVANGSAGRLERLKIDGNGNTIVSNGNVGIGTTTPIQTLDVEGSIRAGGRTRIEMSRPIGGAVGDTVTIGSFSNDGVGKNIRFYLKGHNGGVIDVQTYEINEVAYIGPSTNWLELPLNQNSVSYGGAPAYAIDVYRPNINWTGDTLFVRVRVKRAVGGGTVQLVADYDDDSSFTPITAASSTATAFNATTAAAGGAVDGYYGSVEWAFPVSNGNGWANAGSTGLFVKNSGNVGIGTTAPTHKLSVKGTIRAQEIIVDNTNWADYVFDESYNLAPLSDVEAHIKAKKHLPGIPSAAEIAEHGVSMGDMQSKLLSKIEEITLHMIAQGKAISALQAENAALKAQNANFQQQLGELQAVSAPKL